MRLSTDKRVFAAFWLFGLVNNVLYVVILLAAVDLVGTATPKATVLLADILPLFLLKLCAPFVVHLVPYDTRIYALIALSTTGMVTIAMADATATKLFGIVLALLLLGLGELTFLQLTHYYSDASLHGFSSGTGGAGLAGSFVYLVLTTWIRLLVRALLLVFSVVPLSFLLLYYQLLPARTVPYVPVEPEPLVGPVEVPTVERHFQRTLARLRPLVVPFMVPLVLVYVSEYVINQGILPTLLFPLEEMPMFGRYRDAYVTYGTLYQLGVFVLRLLALVVRVRNLYLPAVLQGVNLAVCVLQLMYVVLPNVYVLMALMFYEGLLGGAAYVNTFMLVLETVALHEREFAMGAVGISDLAGIVVAASVSMWLEPALCGFQVARGRGYCRMD